MGGRVERGVCVYWPGEHPRLRPWAVQPQFGLCSFLRAAPAIQEAQIQESPWGSFPAPKMHWIWCKPAGFIIPVQFGIEPLNSFIHSLNLHPAVLPHIYIPRLLTVWS